VVRGAIEREEELLQWDCLGWMNGWVDGLEAVLYIYGCGWYRIQWYGFTRIWLGIGEMWMSRETWSLTTGRALDLDV